MIVVIKIYFFSGVEENLNLENRQRNIYIFCPFLRFSKYYINFPFDLELLYASRI